MSTKGDPVPGIVMAAHANLYALRTDGRTPRSQSPAVSCSVTGVGEAAGVAQVLGVEEGPRAPGGFLVSQELRSSRPEVPSLEHTPTGGQFDF